MSPADYESAAALFSRHGTLWLESAFCRSMHCSALFFALPAREVTLDSHEGLEMFFLELEECLDRGYWLAGWLSYEAGYGFEKTLTAAGEPPGFPGPLAWFGAYRAPSRFSEEGVRELFEKRAALFPFDPDELSAPHFDLDEETYIGKIGLIREEISKGNVYQVNFTGRYRFSFPGCPQGLFRAMRGTQPSSFMAFVNNGEHTLLSLSPELFFRLSGREIETMPMKGTARRGGSGEEDERIRTNLGKCGKNLAENLMIVDLLRNDLGRICTPGTVGTSGLFRMETYPTLHQMVSTVRGVVNERAGLREIFRALFPSGSVTGAPKIKAMQLVRDLEDGSRGIYTGTIGFITPDREMVFSVAIRTLELFGTRGVYGSGSGIVWDSLAREEYSECRLKAKILTGLCEKEFTLFETMLWSQAYLWLGEHLDRMASSASELGFPWTREGALSYLERLGEELRISGGRFRVRFTLSPDGSFSSVCEPAEHAASPSLVRLCIAGERLDSSNPLLRHKTSERGLYDRYVAAAAEKGYGEVLFLNERGELCEGAISSVFIRKGGRFFTPPLSSGLLPGVYRRYFLATRPYASEKIITLPDLHDAEMIFIGNSLRGLRQAVFTGDQITA